MAKGKKSKVVHTKENKKGGTSFFQDNPITRYLKETRAEMAKVTWPTRDEAIRLTGVVLAVTAGMAVFLGVVDTVFSTLFRLIVGT